MPEIEKLLTSQQVAAQRIERSITNGKKTSLDRRTVTFYENKIIELNKLWEEFDTNDALLQELIVTSKKPCTDKYVTEDHYSDLYTKYSEYVDNLADSLKQKQQAGGSNQTQGGQGPIVVNSSAQLPRINLPKFDGEYEAWRSFHDLFMSLIHKNAQLQPVQKLHYLKGCLTGEAERLLKHVPITGNDYEPAWEKLKQRYENKRILVNTQLKILINQQKILNENSKNLKSLLDTTEECLQQLKILGVAVATWDTLLIFLIVQKLPLITLKLWEEELGDIETLPTFEEFKKFLQTRFRILESVNHTIGASSKTSTPTTLKSYHVIENSSNKCPACNDKHYVAKCKKFLKMNNAARQVCITKSKRCFNCFSGKHRIKDCPSTTRCESCQGKHHSLLHKERMTTQGDQEKAKHYKDERGNNQGTSEQSTSAREEIEAQVFFTQERDNVLLATALVTTLNKKGLPVTLRCLIDPGSQSSFITSKSCKRLGLHGTPAKVEITGLNKSQTAWSNRQVRLQLSACTLDKRALDVEMLVIDKITDLLPSSNVHKGHWEHLKDLQLADPTYWKSGPIDILLGARAFAEIVIGEVKKGPKQTPIAMKTTLGWILLGNESAFPSNKVETFTITTKESDELNSQLKRFWEIEEVSAGKRMSPEDEKCEQFYEKTVQRLKDGTYMVKLPFKNEEGPVLGSSKELALKRFQHLQRKLSLNAQLKADYAKCLDEYSELGHMEEVTTQSTRNADMSYYIPHHAVLKQSTTTKLRVVFDASAKTTNRRSLNEQMLVGPTRQPKLFSTLLKWRKYKVVITADIEKMYRMIWIHPDHRRYQKILWRSPKDETLQEYQLKTVTFGTSSAPYLAIRTLLQLANDEQSNWPLAAKAAHTDFYVDDLLSGADTIPQAKELQRQLTNMLHSGGFNLRKWASNKSEMLEDIKEENREIKNILRFDEQEAIKTLGILWNPGNDNFTFAVNLDKRNASTKRTILSEIASLYDPLGWISPVIISAKLIMQNLWISGCTWDEQVDSKWLQQWQQFKETLGCVTKISIPRWAGCSSDASKMELHGFCDASSQAYAAVVYLRVADEEGTVKSTMLTSKTKVAPIKPITIPRLELNAAVLLARLLKQTLQDMQLENISITAWSDSFIALQWIKSHPVRWKTYVANRTAEIQEIVEPNRWRHVPTDQNPADLGSRGCTASQLVNNRLWWNGPVWLEKSEKHWPNSNIPTKQLDLERRKNIMTTLVVQVSDDILSRYSSISKLKRFVAYIQRFCFNCKNKRSRNTGALTVEEVQVATDTIIRIVQQTSFKEEWKALKKSEQLNRNSSLSSLTPFLDKNNILRVGGRLENANISYNRKHPIILPPKHPVTQAVIRQIHIETLHGGSSLVLNTSRNMYWIVNGKKAISQEINKCPICIRYRKQAKSQLMGNLPMCRVNISKAFQHVGVDYAGPVSIKTSTNRSSRIYKGYFCIFVCMVTKAIHLEAVSDLTSNAFIAALKRFISRRGLCSDMYSDCGTNFKGADIIMQNDLQKAIKEITPEMAQYLHAKGIQWHFNPPSAPHFGGLWEAGVKSVKYHIRRVVGKSVFSFEEYATLLTQIEACLNSRPLCPLSNSTEDLEMLTPGHFLIGQPLNAMPEPSVLHEKVTLGQRWRHLNYMVQHFWNKWSKDYLNRLQQRSKWCTTEDNLRVGEVVIIKEDNTAPTYWLLGKIQEVFPGKDGLVRVAELKTQAGVLRRPVAKLVKLVAKDEQPAGGSQ